MNNFCFIHIMNQSQLDITLTAPGNMERSGMLFRVPALLNEFIVVCSNILAATTVPAAASISVFFIYYASTEIYTTAA